MPSPPSRRGPWFTAALTLLILAITTGLAWGLEELLGLADASAAYLLAVTAVAVLFGTWPAVGAAAASFLAYNFLFTHPRFTFVVADSGQLLNLVLLLVVGIVVGQLAGSQRERARAAERREREARVMSDISRALATAPLARALEQITPILVASAEWESAWVALGSSPGAERPITTAPADPPGPFAPHVVLQRGGGGEPTRWMPVRPPGPPARAEATAALAYRVPLEAGGRQLGGLWSVRGRDRGEPRPEETRVLAAAADQIGQALEQERLRAEATSAELARRSERMKSAVLESVSHDLRTPLAAIRAAAGTLLDAESGGPPDLRSEIAQAIDAEAARMDRLVGNLLEISRIEAGGVTVDLQPYALDDLLATAVRRLGATRAATSPEVSVPADLPYVRVDALLLDEVVTNVIENAMRHAGAAPVRVSATEDAGRVRVVVEDAGPGVPPEALARLFDKFYRVPNPGRPPIPGTGLGLAVAKGLVEAMGGKIEAQPSPMGGLAIVLHLPTAEPPPEDEEAG